MALNKGGRGVRQGNAGSGDMVHGVDVENTSWGWSKL